MTVTKRPLDGIRVVDFCWIGAGSYTTKILADMGADVIKVESTTYLDSLRKAPPFKDGKPGVNRSGYFADRNSSKRSLTVNMKHPEAAATMLDLIRTAHIVTNNFTPGVMERFGLGYEAVSAVKPDIIYVAMSMQGQEGPEANYLGYGLTIGALTGLQQMSGIPGREPAGTGTNFPDHIPNPCHTAFAILAALRHWRRTGEGQRLDVAQTEPMIALLGTAVTAAGSGGPDYVPNGNRNRSGVLQGVYPTKGEDAWIAISIESDREWIAFSGVVGSFGPRWASADVRLSAQDELDAEIGSLTSTFDRFELMAALQREDVTCGVVQTAADVTTDAQLVHRNHWQRITHGEAGEMLYNAPPYRFSGFSSELRGPAPELGEHTDEIATDLLGLSAEQIKAGRDSGLLV